MKRIFAIAIIISVALVSCKKSSTPGIGTSGVQATIGNTTTVFNVLAYASPYNYANWYNNTDTSYEIEISATSSSASSQPYMNIYLYSNQPITSGTVFSDTAAQTGYWISVLPSYTSRSLYIENGQNYDPNEYTYPSYGTAGVKSSPTTLTITALSATSISGTFQGALYLQEDSTGIKEVITNGKFIAPIVVNND